MRKEKIERDNVRERKMCERKTRGECGRVKQEGERARDDVV